MPKNGLSESVASFREFNRFYTKQIGLLNQGLLSSRFSLPRARLLYELAQQEEITATELTQQLEIDAGYLSRLVTGFEKQGLLRRVVSKADSRRRLLQLTAEGRQAFAQLDQRSRKQAQAMLSNLSAEDRKRLLHAMQTTRALLSEDKGPASTFVLRPHEPGDIGWMVYRHGLLYSEEYGFDETFEGLVAEILAKFLQGHDRKRERTWIAEQNGERVGSIMIVDAGEQVAQLRLLLVETKARGKGLGARLIDECVRFSKRQDYHKIKLWTQSILLEARHLYAKAGFEVVEEKPHHSFGHDLVAEVWELGLR